MTADYAALEERVAELERQMRHVLPAKVDAVAYAASLIHEDLRAFREETRGALGRQGEVLGRHGEQLTAIRGHLERQGEQLAEILRRLPGEPA